MRKKQKKAKKSGARRTSGAIQHTGPTACKFRPKISENPIKSSENRGKVGQKVRRTEAVTPTLIPPALAALELVLSTSTPRLWPPRVRDIPKSDTWESEN
jgi:hypothetical protein